MLALVTGASGFVGSAVARRLLAGGHRVRVLLRPASDQRNVAALPVEIVYGDLTDPASLARAIEGCETLFHVAADYRLWAHEPDELYRSNVTGTVNIMRAALTANVARVVYTSSVATLGLNKDGSLADEATPVALADMIGHYKRSKFLAEAEVMRIVEHEGLPAVIVNPSAPVGPRDIKPTPTGRMILDVANGRMPAYVDTGLNIVHVDDVAEGHLLAFERGTIGERYVLGAENMSLRQIIERVAAIAGQKPARLRLPHNAILPIAYAAEAIARFSKRAPMVTIDGVRLSKKKMFFSIEKARRELGYMPRSADAALIDAVAWFRENGYCPKSR